MREELGFSDCAPFFRKGHRIGGPAHKTVDTGQINRSRLDLSSRH
jgi:hypothetical protein